MWNLLEPKLFNEIMVDFIKEGNVKIYPQIVEE
jgi:regulator of sigma D